MDRTAGQLISYFKGLLLVIIAASVFGCTNNPHFIVASGLDGELGRLRYSNDGVTWGVGDMTLLVQSNYMEALTYGDDHIVGVGIGNYTFESENGIDWNTTNLGNTQYWYDIAFGEYHNQSPWQPYFVAVGYNGGVMYTTDFGQTWTNGTSGVTDRLYGVAFGLTTQNLSTFVTVGENGNILYSLTAGNTWIQHSAGGTSNDLFTVYYGNGRYIAAGESGTMLYSTNGAAWNAMTSNTTKDIYKVKYGIINNSPIWIAVGKEGRILTADALGNNWVEQVQHSLYHWTDVAIGDGKIVVVGYRNDGSGIQEGKVIYSTDGINWNPSQVFPGRENYLWAVTYRP